MVAVNSAAQLRALAVRLQVAGAGGLKVELTRAIRLAAHPLVDDVIAAARADLPRRGGLAERVAVSPIKVSVRTGPYTAGVRITTSEHDTVGTNRGSFRHPVFGHMGTWVQQEAPKAKGWFTTTLENRGPEVLPYVLAAMEVTAQTLTARGL